MTTTGRLLSLLLGLLAATCCLPMSVRACCAVFPKPDQPVLNADQTVLLIWDAATHTEHFIRRATFRGAANDIGFLVPSPTQPELAEAGEAAFPQLAERTKPEVVTKTVWSFNRYKSLHEKTAGAASVFGRDESPVRVLEEKLVAGFNAVVLEADSAEALTAWFTEHGYAFSPAVAAWVQPYIAAKWKITAFRVAKSPDGSPIARVDAPALRLSFHSDRLLFPYREPDPQGADQRLGVADRLLRLYVVSDARYSGQLTKESPWTGNAVWSNPLPADTRSSLLTTLKLPATTGPSTWWLTEFEDHWPYRVAPADLYFDRAPDKSTLKRPPIIHTVYRVIPLELVVLVSVVALLLCVWGVVAWRRYLRCRRSAR